MNTYKNKYIIWDEFEAENDKDANKIKEKNLNAIFSNGEFYVKKIKIESEIFENEVKERTRNEH